MPAEAVNSTFPLPHIVVPTGVDMVGVAGIALTVVVTVGLAALVQVPAIVLTQ